MASTALVTGGGGFIASHLLPALVSSGWNVRTCGRRPRPGDLAGEIGYCQVDLADSSADLAPVVDGVSHVFHLAGASSSRSSEEEMFHNNVDATAHLLDAVSAAGVDVVVHMSSTSIYGEQEQLPSPVPETVQPTPSRAYGKAKWQAEQVVWRAVGAGLPAVVLRPVSVHGAGATKLLASALLDVAIERYAGLGSVMVGPTPVEQRLLHVDDVVAATLYLADHAPARGRAFNLAMPHYPSSHEVAALLADELGLGFEVVDDADCGPSTEERAAARDRMLAEGMTDDILFTPERFRFMRKANRNNRIDLAALLGTGFHFGQTDLKAAVADLAAWYGERRWIL